MLLLTLICAGKLLFVESRALGKHVDHLEAEVWAAERPIAVACLLRPSQEKHCRQRVLRWVTELCIELGHGNATTVDFTPGGELNKADDGEEGGGEWQGWANGAGTTGGGMGWGDTRCFVGQWSDAVRNTVDEDYLALLRRTQVVVTAKPCDFDGDYRTWEA